MIQITLEGCDDGSRHQSTSISTRVNRKSLESLGGSHKHLQATPIVLSKVFLTTRDDSQKQRKSETCHKIQISRLKHRIIRSSERRQSTEFMSRVPACSETWKLITKRSSNNIFSTREFGFTKSFPFLQTMRPKPRQSLPLKKRLLAVTAKQSKVQTRKRNRKCFA